MIVPNQLNILTRVFLYLFTRDKCTLFYAYIFALVEFDKMQIPLDAQKYNCSLVISSWFGDYRSLRFCAVTSVAALFILQINI